MKIARIKNNKFGETYGVVSKDFNKVITKTEIQEQTGVPIPQNIKDFIFGNWIDELKKYESKLVFSLNIEDVELLVPLPNPSKIICLAFNYYDHAQDAGLTPSQEPVIFIKPRTALNNPFNDIRCPGNVQRLDYEAELA
ncbi:MAG TPA: fumarylacetoacetate hydrolase family protein, partial [Nitrososphaeraceae archaeon]|nr:fumarylacetoacetate hydrolase family protein [Nitrososphaeraceae archaeon]